MKRLPVVQITSDMLTTEQVGQILNVSRQTVARWVRNKKITAIRLPSGMIRITTEELKRIRATVVK